MSSAVGNYNSKTATYTRGPNTIDVRSLPYGAGPNESDRGNRQAFQAAIDAAFAHNGASGGEVNRQSVYVPSAAYGMDFGPFMGKVIDSTGADVGTGVGLYGEDRNSTTLVCNNTVLNLGIKRLDLPVGSGTLVDAHGTLDSQVAPTTGVKFGIDITKARLFDISGPLYRNGDVLWSLQRQFTVDLVCDLTGLADYTVLAGWENTAADDVPGIPWGIGGEYLGSNRWRARFGLGLEKTPPLIYNPHVIASDFVSTPVLRITAQVDLDGHGGSSGPVVVMWINGLQVTTSGIQGTSLPAVGGVMLDNWLRPFTLGPVTKSTPSGGKIFGFRVHNGLRYVYGATGSAQTYISGGTPTDFTQYFGDLSNLLSMVRFTETPSDVADYPAMSVFNSSLGVEAVPFSGSTYNSSAIAPDMPLFQLLDSWVSNLTLAGNSGYTGAGILADGMVSCTLSKLRVQAKQLGFATYGQASCYENNFEDLELYVRHQPLVSRMAYNQQYRKIGTSQMGPRVFFTADSSSSARISGYYMSPGNGSTSHYIFSVGASLNLEDVVTDNEGLTLRGCCENYFHSRSDSDPVEVIWDLPNEGMGSYRRPAIMLDGPTDSSEGNTNNNQTAHVWLRSNLMNNSGEQKQPGMIEVRSPNWQTHLVSPVPYQHAPFVLDSTGGRATRVRVIDRGYSGPPRMSRWSRNLNQLETAGIVSGRPRRYTPGIDGAFGTATPPWWYASDIFDDDPTRLAVDLVGHCYWSAGSPAAPTIFGSWSDAVQCQNLDWIFRQVAPSIPILPTGLMAGLSGGAVRINYNGKVVEVNGPGYARQSVTFTFPSPGRAEASAFSFGPATGAWDDGGWQRYTAAAVIFDTAGNHIASADFTPVSISSGYLNFTLGQMFMQHQPLVSNTGFAPAVEDALAKAWLGGVTLPTWDLYLALSTAPADVTVNPTEPTDAAYQRVHAPTTAWSAATSVNSGGTRLFATAPTDHLRFDVGTLANSTPLNFATPTASWGTLRSVYLMSAATGGTVLAAVPMILPRVADTSTGAVGFAAGGFRVARS